ncbi:hypothetical protein MAR_014576 [Mya arenaria]|uniref:Uncharacterized protein n=1 Tax=Mya arenaria TaxID=6604 RepID=A0ABY7G6C8_MYAAR|nr:hypothetical protein MAR_014576 [Mya arenaria]
MNLQVFTMLCRSFLVGVFIFTVMQLALGYSDDDDQDHTTMNWKEYSRQDWHPPMMASNAASHSSDVMFVFALLGVAFVGQYILPGQHGC